MDNGPELISQALQHFCDDKVGLTYVPLGQPWDTGRLSPNQQQPGSNSNLLDRCQEGVVCSQALRGFNRWTSFEFRSARKATGRCAVSPTAWR